MRRETAILLFGLWKAWMKVLRHEFDKEFRPGSRDSSVFRRLFFVILYLPFFVSFRFKRGLKINGSRTKSRCW